MDKKIAGKYAGLTGAVALIITIICQITHNGGIPWINIEKICITQLADIATRFYYQFMKKMDGVQIVVLK